MLKKLFNEIGLTETAHRVYLLLLENGTSSARILAEKLGIPRPSVYDNINALIQKGLVLERLEGNKKLFQVDDVEHLPQLLSERIETLKTEKEELIKLLPELKKRTRTIEPKIKFFSGVDGVEQVLNDMLWYENIETYAMWPITEMLGVLSKEYFEKHNRRRITKNISIRAIWPENRDVPFKNYPFLGTQPGHLRKLRIGPKDMVVDMGYWIYEDKVALLSSRKETFGLTVHSQDFADMMKAQFEVIWKFSKPIHSDQKETESFIKTVS